MPAFLPPRLHHRRVRLYDVVRSAHLERAHHLAPAAIVYQTRRYDFEAALEDNLELRHAGPLGSAVLIARSRPTDLEVNEPLCFQGLPAAFLTLLALRATRQTPTVSTYAIENLDRLALPPYPGIRARLRRRLDVVMARYVWDQADRVVYGTSAAQAVYERSLGRPRKAATAITPPFPAASTEAPTEPRPIHVAFVGAFVPRKGLPEVMRAWPLVLKELPHATLHVMGKGALLPQVEAFAARHASVSLSVDPSRETIRESMRRARALVLPSQPEPAWREQIGLPILEGLEQGCRIVASSETGIADWLRAHGHGVVDVPTQSGALSAAIVEQLRVPTGPETVLASLGPTPGWLTAARWMTAPTAHG